MIPGLSYLTSSFALILAPTFAGRFYFVMAGPALIGEASLCLWLIVKGVNAERSLFPRSLACSFHRCSFTPITRSDVSAILLQHGRAPQTWCALRPLDQEAAATDGCTFAPLMRSQKIIGNSPKRSGIVAWETTWLYAGKTMDVTLLVR